MSSTKIVPTAANDVSDPTLKTGPARMLTFLQGVADPGIRAKFAPLGWSEQRLEEAWELLAIVKEASVLASSPVSDPVTQAIAACEDWQSIGLVRARAMLQLSFPEQAAFVFHDFIAGKGTAAVLSVSTFLDRRQALENSVERKASRKADHEALVVLEEAGVTAKVLKGLQGHVATVQTVVAAPHTQVNDAEAMLLDGLRKIHAWLNAWGEMARTVITRRDQLIRLGIAKRRPKKGKVVVVVPPVVAPTQPASPPVAPTGTTPIAPPAGGVITPPVASPTPVTPATPGTPNGVILAEADETAPQSRAA